MADMYAREADRTLDYEREATEVVEEGELVYREEGGGVRAFDPATDTRIDGIIPHREVGDRLTETMEEYVPYDEVYEYDVGDGPIPIQPLQVNDLIAPRTVRDDTETEPTFVKNEEVGIATIAGEQSVVPAGYTDSAGTQYGDGGAGEYVKLGLVDAAPSKYEQTTFAERIETRVSGENL